LNLSRSDISQLDLNWDQMQEINPKMQISAEVIRVEQIHRVFF